MHPPNLRVVLLTASQELAEDVRRTIGQDPHVRLTHLSPSKDADTILATRNTIANSVDIACIEIEHLSVSVSLATAVMRHLLFGGGHATLILFGARAVEVSRLAQVQGAFEEDPDLFEKAVADGRIRVLTPHTPLVDELRSALAGKATGPSVNGKK